MNAPRPGALASELYVAAAASGAAAPTTSEAMLAAIFHAAKVGIVVADLNGRRLKVNGTFCAMTGHSEAELLAQAYVEEIHPEDREHSTTMRRELISGARDSYACHRRYRRHQGGWFPASVTVSLVRDDAGRPAFTVAVIEDITERMAGAQALAESEERYRTTFAEAGLGISQSAIDGTRLQVNRTFCEMLGHSQAELLALPVGALLHPDEAATFNAARARLLRGEVASITLERRFPHKDGRWIWGQGTVTVARDAAGTPAYTISIVHDITERKLAERALRESEERFRATFEQAPFAIAHYSLEGRWYRVNRRFTDLFGYSKHELQHLRAEDLNHPDELATRQENMARLVRGETDRVMREKRFVHRDGHELWVSVNTSVVRDRDGNVDYVTTSFEDIGERRRAEQRLRASEERFRSLIAFSSDWYWEQDADLRFTAMSGSAAAHATLLSDDFIGKHRWDLPWLMSAADWAEHKALLGRREPFRDLVLSRYAKDGSLHHISISGEPVFDTDGRFAGYRGVSSDVTERVAAERRLRESEARSRLLALVVEQSSEGIVIKDLNNRVVTWNAGAERLFGHSATDAVGRNITRLLYREASDGQVERRIAAVRSAQRETYRASNVTRDGRTLAVEVSVAPLYDDSGVHIGEISATRDVTERVRAEQALRESESRNRLLATVVEQTNAAIVTKDLDNRVLTWNPGAAALYGYSAEAAIGQNITRLVIPGADDARVQAAIADTRACRNYTRFDVRHDRNGAAFDVEVAYSPLFDIEGQHIGEISISRDITARLAAERALRASEARSRLLAAVVEQSSEAIITKDLDNIVVSWNGGAERMYGWSAAEAVGRNITHLVHPKASAAEVAARIEKLRAARPEVWHALSFRRDGSTMHVDVNVSPLHDENGRHIGEITMVRDVTQRVRAEEALRDHQLFLEQAQAVGGIGSWAINLPDGSLTWSDETLRVFGLTRETFDNRTETFWSRVYPDDLASVRDAIARALAARTTYTQEFRIVRADGEVRWIYEHAAIICDAGGEPERIVGVTQDVTERRAARERIEFLATRDPLTELPNRVLLLDRIGHGLASAARNGTQVALLFIDLDRFKTINDSLGHQVGDQMLKQVAERLSRCVRREDTLARLGGDEFVVLLEGLSDAQIASQVARKVLKLLSRPYTIDGHQLSTSCSIGISLYPTDGEDAQTLMKNADAAMYHAKERGRGNYQYFSSDLHSRAVERLSIETALRRALERDELELHYQPQVRIEDSRVVGMEALLRWNHPEQGLLAPARFIRIAEESGLIVPMGEWALNAACAQMRAWQDMGYQPGRLAVNVSVGQISRGFVRTVGRILELHRIEGSQLELEMTESLLMQQVEENIRLLRRLGESGVQVALDDFGTGYSSLAYLKKFPIDALKVDRTFVRDLVDDPDDSAITAAVIAIGHHLQLRVVAEGVESAEQLAILKAMRCDEYQGYLFSRPVPAATFAQRFLAGQGGTATVTSPPSTAAPEPTKRGAGQRT
jgi:diguanylate cyclase (GGDEF)-like protein/PAS domain S-box-containing protein